MGANSATMFLRGARDIWEHRTSLHHQKIKIAENPLTVRISGSLQKSKKQSNLCLTTYLTTYTTTIEKLSGCGAVGSARHLGC